MTIHFGRFWGPSGGILAPFIWLNGAPKYIGRNLIDECIIKSEINMACDVSFWRYFI